MTEKDIQALVDEVLKRILNQNVKEDVKKVLSEDIDIIAPSCGLAPKTPLANVKALVEARNEYFNI